MNAAVSEQMSGHVGIRARFTRRGWWALVMARWFKMRRELSVRRE